MTILRHPDRSFYPVGFFDFSDAPGGRLVFVADIAALSGMEESEFMSRVPQHDARELRDWCAERNLRITGVTHDVNEGEEIHFACDERRRFEFRMRWNV